MRTIVIGDIHGCAKALRTLLGSLDLQLHDRVIFLGDYIDRGPDSRGVIDQILQLRRRCRVVALRGNHEIMLLGVMVSKLPPELWLASGGKATLSSYGGTLARMPETHLQFLCDLQPFYETESSIFVHAGYQADLPMHRQCEQTLYWDHLAGTLPEPHCSGKRVFVGHTPQASGAVLDRGHLVCLDTYCFGGGYLTAMDVQCGQTWQSDARGHLRRQRSRPLLRACGRQLRRWITRIPRTNTAAASAGNSRGVPADVTLEIPAANPPDAPPDAPSEAPAGHPPETPTGHPRGIPTCLPPGAGGFPATESHGSAAP